MIVSSTRWRHLVGRFFDSLAARVDAENLATVDQCLSPAERGLFLTMTVSDQRHSIDLCERLRHDGQGEPDLLCAALLHDVGKAAGNLSLLHRVAFSLVVMIVPPLADWLGRSASPRWRRPFYLAAHHPRLGAAAAGRAGSNDRVVRLIAGHASPGADPLGRILYTYDRGM